MPGSVQSVLSGVICNFRLGSLLLQFSDIGGQRIHDDDAVDQLNHWATVGLLMALALGTGAKQFVGTPIHCWLPAEYKHKMYQGYADSYCWINSMYYIPFNEAIPFSEEDRWEFDFNFYRFVQKFVLKRTYTLESKDQCCLDTASRRGEEGADA